MASPNERKAAGESGPSPCIACGRALEPAANDEYFAAIPYAGTQFTSHGHYGSTAYDPDAKEWLEINVCDPCLLERRERVSRVRPYPALRPPPPDRSRWVPGEDIA